MNYLHVIMRMSSDPSKQVVVYDLPEEVLKELFLPKFNARAPFAWESLTISPADVTDVWIRKTTDTVYALLRRRQMESPFGDYTLLKVAEEGKDITGDYEIHIGKMLGNTVFIVHGRNQHARIEVSNFLNKLKVGAIEWVQAVAATGKTNPSISEILEVAFSRARAIVVLLTPDDEARLRAEYRHQDDKRTETDFMGQPRQNVLFEAGMAWRQSPQRTVIVEMGVLRPMSDISGLLTLKLDNSPEARKAFAQRLQAAGCDVDMTGNDWLTVGDFNIKPSR